MASEGDERLEVLDERGMPTGTVKRRAHIHRDGDWHAALHLWVLHADGSVLLQRRSKSKELAAGLVDVSVAGHVREGETVLALLREAEEELGLVLRPGQLEFLETIRSERSYPDGALDREFQDVYAAAVPAAPLDSYSLRCDEVAVLYEVPLARALELYRAGTPTQAVGWDCMARPNNALLIADDLIAPARASTVASLERLAAWWAERGETRRVPSE